MSRRIPSRCGAYRRQSGAATRRAGAAATYRREMHTEAAWQTRCVCVRARVCVNVCLMGSRVFEGSGLHIGDEGDG